MITAVPINKVSQKFNGRFLPQIQNLHIPIRSIQMVIVILKLPTQMSQ
jgi:hypothetical protein